MRKIIIYIAVLLLIATIVHAEPLYNYQTLDVEFSASSSITINPKQDPYFIDYMRARLFFFPKESEYSISRVTTTPQATQENNEIVYEWREPEDKRLEYSLQSMLTTSNNVPEITEKVPFPTTFPSELSFFTRATAHIDSNNMKIKEQASKIVDGEDDLFIALFKLGSWVEQNVEYDLSTLTIETSQKASWVLENRVGICDEMTSLFIAMARSLGIPARFVSGISYTTHPAFDKNWLPHGWAEVYIPDVGWVPFDPTYKQFGYVDATHIKLGDSVDPVQAATKFEWTGNVEVVPSKIQFDVDVKDTGEKAELRVSLSNEILREVVSFDSYNVVRTVVQNNLNQYVTTSLFAETPTEVTVEEQKQHIFLKPNEAKEVFWLLKVDEGLKDQYLYTFPVAISTEQDITEVIEFTSREHAVYIDKGQAELLIYEREKENEQKTLTHNVEVECELKPQSVFINETININCNVKNLGNTILEKLNFCSNADCKKLTIYIAEEREANFNFSQEEVGLFEKVIRLNGMSKALHIPYEVRDKPIISVKEIEAPDKVMFEEEFALDFSIDRESYSIPRLVTVNVNGGNIRKVFELGNVSALQRFSVTSLAKYLKEGENNITIRVEWQDRLGESFLDIIEVPVVLDELTFGQKVQNLLLRFGLLFRG